VCFVTLLVSKKNSPTAIVFGVCTKVIVCIMIRQWIACMGVSICVKGLSTRELKCSWPRALITPNYAMSFKSLMKENKGKKLCRQQNTPCINQGKGDTPEVP
jgi:hypothetical protein